MIEMIFASMAGFWLGLYLLVALGSLIWASETDSFFVGISVLIVAWAVGEWVFGIPILASIIANPLMLIVYTVLYVAFGAIYTRMWKLPNFVKKNRDNIQTSYDRWKDLQSRQHDMDWRERVRGVLPGEKKEKEEKPTVDVSFETFLNSSSYTYSVRNNKDRVASWVLLWPASIIWELSHKPFIWVWEQVYYGLGRVFEKANHDMARKILEEKNK
jgi:hypothetical protein